VNDQKGGSLQVSYLWVHEWLWNFFDRVDFQKTATFNRILQSQKLSEMTEREYYQLRPSELLLEFDRYNINR
jgi:hypothetical protein